MLEYQLGCKTSECATLHTQLAKAKAEAAAFDDAACKHNARANRAEAEVERLEDIVVKFQPNYVRRAFPHLDAKSKLGEKADRPRGKGGRFESAKTKAAGL